MPLKAFPKRADFISTKEGDARLVKTDIFKQIMFYAYKDSGKLYSLSIDRVSEIMEMNKNGEKPESLMDVQIVAEVVPTVEFEDGVGQVSLNSLEKYKKKKKRRKNRNRKAQGQQQNASQEKRKPQQAQAKRSGQGGQQQKQQKSGGGNNRRNRGRGRSGGNQGQKPSAKKD